MSSGAGVLWMLVRGSAVQRRGFFVRRERLRAQLRIRTKHLQPAPRTAAPGTAGSPARELVTTYCVSCHNPKLKAGSFVLDPAEADQVSQLAGDVGKGRAEAALALDAAAAQPPSRQHRPTTPFPHGSRRSSIARPPRTRIPGRPADLHRLNRAEYANAVRDLLGVQVDGTLMLPPDEQAHGFDTNADALSVVPALLDRYLTAAAKISRLAVGDPTLRPCLRALHRRQEQLERAHVAVADRSAWRRVSARLARRHRGASLLPGRRRIHLEGPARQDVYGHGARAERAERDRVPRRRQARRAVHARRARVGAAAAKAASSRRRGRRKSAVHRGRRPRSACPAEGGPARGHRHRREIRCGKGRRARTRSHPDLGTRLRRRHPRAARLLGAAHRRAVQRPDAAGIAQPPAHLRVLADRTPATKHRVRRRFCRPWRSARTAGRRRKRTSQTLLEFYKAGRAEGTASRPASVRRSSGCSSARIFCSVSRPIPPASSRASRYRISDIELASRLSFFLWSSIPDDELLDTGDSREAARCEGVRCAGAAHARRPARAHGARAEFLQPVAAGAQRLAADARRQPQVSVVRRQPAHRVRHGNGAVPRKPAAG